VVYTLAMDKKTKICAELDKLGVVYNKRLGEEKLQVILDDARTKSQTVVPTPEVEVTSDPVVVAPEGPVEPVAPVEPTEPVAQVEPEPVQPTGVVKILDKHGFTVRTFSLVEHGDEYVELAQSFAQKKGLRIA